MKRGTFKIINSTEIEIYNPTNTISLLPEIKRANIISVSVNGILEDKWIYVLNDIFMLESDMGFYIESSDIITIKTDINIARIFKGYEIQQKLNNILDESDEGVDKDISEWIRVYKLNNKL